MGQKQHAKKVLFCQTEGLCKVKETAKNPLSIQIKKKMYWDFWCGNISTGMEMHGKTEAFQDHNKLFES